MPRRFFIALLAPFLVVAQFACVTAPAKVGKFPHLEFDVTNKVVRVECEALDTTAPLEFFVCKNGNNEYESALRSLITPSDLHTALLAIGLKPGSPVSYSEALKKMIPPQGPPLHITMEYQKDGKTILTPANRWLRDVKTKKEPKSFTWVFCGSRVMSDGKYAADVTGYIVSVVNFDLTMIDIPELASSANETLEWERNPDVAPKAGTKVWMIIEPAGKSEPPVATASGAAASVAAASGATASGATASGATGTAHDSATAPTLPWATAPSSAPDTLLNAPPTTSSKNGAIPTSEPTSQPTGLSDVHVDQAKVDALEKYWESKVNPHANALREAAQAHYQVIGDLRKEQQRLIDEADHIQRAIDDLEKKYQDMTTPHPEN